MSQDIPHNLDEILAPYREVITPGSIEESSVVAAFNMAAEGQQDVAENIIGSLLVDDRVKKELQEASGKWEVESEKGGRESGVSSSHELQRTEEAIQNTRVDSSALRSAIEIPPVSQPPEPDASMSAPPAPSVPPVPPTPPPAPATHGESKTPETQIPPATSPQQPVPNLWSSFENIVAQVNAEAANAPDPLATALADKAEQQEGRVQPAYDKVFASEIDHTHDYEVPGVIKTYAEAADVGERREREAQEQRATDVLKVQPFFDRVEAYLKRAYEMNDPHVITSATNQFTSLRERYPYYVEDRAAHIAAIEQVIAEGSAASQPSRAQGGQEPLATPAEIVPGMTISGDTHTYQVQSIQDNMVEFVDQDVQAYHVPLDALEQALGADHVRPDDFFDGYRA